MTRLEVIRTRSEEGERLTKQVSSHMRSLVILRSCPPVLSHSCHLSWLKNPEPHWQFLSRAVCSWTVLLLENSSNGWRIILGFDSRFLLYRMLKDV
jgi:hypothetical protein